MPEEVPMVAFDGDLAEITWTTNQAAEAAGVEPRRIRVWAHRGKLHAVNPKATHPRYRALEVLTVEAAMRKHAA
jgi:hypothetical protein